VRYTPSASIQVSGGPRRAIFLRQYETLNLDAREMCQAGGSALLNLLVSSVLAGHGDATPPPQPSALGTDSCSEVQLGIPTVKADEMKIRALNLLVL